MEHGHCSKCLAKKNAERKFRKSCQAALHGCLPADKSREIVGAIVDDLLGLTVLRPTLEHYMQYPGYKPVAQRVFSRVRATRFVSHQNPWPLFAERRGFVVAGL